MDPMKEEVLESFITIDPLETHSNDDNVKSIINNVFEKCEQEKKNGHLVFPLDQCMERASFYTGLPKSDIYNEYQNFTNAELPISDINQCIVIMRAVNSILLNESLRQTSMDCTICYIEYKNQCKLISLPPLNLKVFSDLLIFLGYVYKMDSKGKLYLMERPKQMFDRFHYLKSILKYRNIKDKQFYYIDERIIDAKCKFIKYLSQNNKNQTEKCDTYYVFYYVVSSKKYECGFVTSQTCYREFRRWLIEIALPKMAPESVIIMDENCHNNLCMEDNITEYHTKKDMMKYLKTKDIPYSEDMRKAELFELITKCVQQTQKHSILYNYFSAHGHELLCLPPKLTGLSLTELLWEHVRTMNIYNENDNDKLRNIKHAVHKYVSSVSQKTLTHLENKLIEMENEIFAMDTAVELYFETEAKIVEPDEF